MQVNRSDADACEILLGVLGKLRFDLNGVECVRLADALTWLAKLRQRVVSECDGIESTAKKTADDARIKKLADDMAEEICKARFQKAADGIVETIHKSAVARGRK